MLLIENRYGNVGMRKEERLLSGFSQEFENLYAMPLLESHLKILQQKKTNFVGTKSLCSALKLVSIMLKCKKTRHAIQGHIQSILYEVSLPLMLLTQQEYESWSDNPVEYIRMQVDQSNTFNVKKNVIALIKIICSIKTTRKQKVSDYLQGFLQVLVGNLEQQQSDFRVKEALLHTIGLLNT